MSKSYENHINKQTQIAKAAEGLFLAKGYTATAMDAVAKEAGVTKQTVYRYFASKEELFEHIIKNMSDHQPYHTFGQGDVLEELISFAEDFITVHMQSKKLEFYRLMVSEGNMGGNLGQAFRDARQSLRKKPLTEYLSDKLTVSHPETIADMFCAMLLYIRPQILMGSTSIPDREEIRNHARLSSEIFLNGLLSL